jgi:hypothetical protein
LFYRLEGTIKDPSNLKLIVEDILPMNKGTQAYTEYTFDERVLDYMIENETMEKGWKMGHIHSHNTMPVFFSGTDWSELEDNAPNHNFYLSLIVNNFMDFCAKVCFISEAKEAKMFDFIAKDEEGNEYTHTSEEYVIEDKKLITYDCDIESPTMSLVIDPTFKSRVVKIIEDAAKVIVNTVAPKTTTYGRTGGAFGNGWGDFLTTKETYDTPPRIKDITMTGQDLEDTIEAFSMYVFNEGATNLEHIDLEDVLHEYLKFDITGEEIAKAILPSYNKMYLDFFKVDSIKGKEAEYISMTELLLDECMHVAKTDLTPELKSLMQPTLEGLRNKLHTFKTVKI